MNTYTEAPAPLFRFILAGCVEYRAAWEWQRSLVSERSAGECADTLLLLEHPPTVTLGRAAHHANILTPPDELSRQGVALVETDRGGDVTYHAPGQLVGYPILKLSHYGGSVIGYVRNLEESIIRLLARYDIEGTRRDGLTGVWVGQAKIASIGVRCSASGVTSHGFALNVSPDLSGFAHIVPCGLSGCAITSLQHLLGYTPAHEEVTERMICCFAAVFGLSTFLIHEIKEGAYETLHA